MNFKMVVREFLIHGSEGIRCRLVCVQSVDRRVSACAEPWTLEPADVTVPAATSAKDVKVRCVLRVLCSVSPHEYIYT